MWISFYLCLLFLLNRYIHIFVRNCVLRGEHLGKTNFMFHTWRLLTFGVCANEAFVILLLIILEGLKYGSHDYKKKSCSHMQFVCKHSYCPELLWGSYVRPHVVTGCVLSCLLCFYNGHLSGAEKGSYTALSNHIFISLGNIWISTVISVSVIVFFFTKSNMHFTLQNYSSGKQNLIPQAITIHGTVLTT